ncbi:MAG: hypothetical protein LBJ25_07100 [Candidatus Margulisbacteria bacterium]|nr:hypothetical protein [Candidatus Margulisiibacteriota bacterium]
MSQEKRLNKENLDDLFIYQYLVRPIRVGLLHQWEKDFAEIMQLHIERILTYEEFAEILN